MHLPEQTTAASLASFDHWSISREASNLHIPTVILCVMALCHCLVGGYQHIIGRQCLHLQVHWNSGTHLPRRSQYGYSPVWKLETFSTYSINECVSLMAREVRGLPTMPVPLNPPNPMSTSARSLSLSRLPLATFLWIQRNTGKNVPAQVRCQGALTPWP
jgi:hypothetical protein